jgi:hypothetical protein
VTRVEERTAASRVSRLAESERISKTLYRLAVTFRPGDDGTTNVTMIGQAPVKVREELARLGSP